MEIIERVTLEDIRRARPVKIYYAIHTCWWTHDPTHLSRMPPATTAEILRAAENLRLNSSTPNAPLDDFIVRATEAHKYRLPCDPRGSVLLETENVEVFLRAAEDNAEHYGRHGIRAFMAAHNSNCVVSLADLRSTSAASWDEYNDALDRLDNRRN